MSETGASTPIDDVVTRLVERFPGVGRDRIEAVVAAELRTFDDARVTDFVPVLVEHQARDMLHREARSAPLPAEVAMSVVGTPHSDDPAERDPAEIERQSRARGLYLGDIDS